MAVMGNQEMWESRYRDENQHTPDGVEPHPVVMEQAEVIIERSISGPAPVVIPSRSRNSG